MGHANRVTGFFIRVVMRLAPAAVACLALVLAPKAAALLTCGGRLVCYTSTTTETVSPNPAVSGQDVTFKAVVTGGPGGVGSVTFNLDGVAVGQPVPIDASGNATLVMSTGAGGTTLSAGTHTYSASYSGAFWSGDGVSYSVSTSASDPTATFTATRQADTTLTSLASSSGGQSSYGQAVTFSAHVTGTPHNPGAGSVTFLVDGTPAATSAVNAAGNASYVTSSLPAGIHHVVAQYGAYTSATDTFAASQSTALVQAVAPVQHTTAVTLSSSPSGTIFRQALTLTAHVTEGSAAVSVGSLTIYVDGSPVATSPVNATGAVSYTTTALGPGPHQISAQYGGYTGPNDVYAPAASPTGTVTVGLRPTQTVLTGTPNPATEKQRVTFSATVTDAGTAVGAGSATLTVDGKGVATEPVDAQGHARFSLGPLSPGSHTVTASFSGTSTELPSTSPVTTETVAQPPAEPVIAASTFFTFRSLPGGDTEPLEFEVVNLPAGAHLHLECLGRRCPIKALSASMARAPACHEKRCAARGRTVNLLPRLAGKRFPAGTRLELDITRKGWREKRYVFSMRAHQSPSVKVSYPVTRKG